MVFRKEEGQSGGGGIQKKWVFAALVLMGLLYPGAVHELQRWEECLSGCQTQFVENEHVLNLNVCKDPVTLSVHGSKASDMCNKAAQENLATPRRCAWRRFWKEGEVYGIYARVAHSQWMLYGLVLPTLLFTIYMIFSTYRSEKEGRRQEREQRYMLEAMKDVARSMSGAQRQQQQQMVPYQPTSTRAMLPVQQPIAMLVPDTSYGARQLEDDGDGDAGMVPARRRRLRARRGRKRNGDQLVTVL